MPNVGLTAPADRRQARVVWGSSGMNRGRVLADAAPYLFGRSQRPPRNPAGLGDQALEGFRFG